MDEKKRTFFNEQNKSYLIAFLVLIGFGLLIFVIIYLLNPVISKWALDGKQDKLWEVVLKAVGGYVAVIGAVITAFKYIDEKAHQQRKDREEEDQRKDEIQRERAESVLKEHQDAYRRLAQSLARIKNYDPGDIPDWENAKQFFYQIYWGEISLVADDVVMEVVKPFSDKLYRAEKKDKKELNELSDAITKQCRQTLISERLKVGKDDRTASGGVL